MKTKFITLLFALVASTIAIWASDTLVDGVWYDFDNQNLTASVTFHGSSYDSYLNEYIGAVDIPSSVTYNAINYSVTSIGNDAFLGCTGLTSVNIPNSITSIGWRAFYGCSGLTSIDIPNSVTSIGTGALYNCSGLTSPVHNVHVFVFMPTSYSGAYTIPDGIESIAGGAFSNCTGLTAIEIPNSVTSIEVEAFSRCSSLTSIEIPNSVTIIKDFTFYNCTSLTSIIIPNSITSIEEGAFDGCNSLTSIEIPNSVAIIKDYTFYGCIGLTSIEIPNSVTSIGSSAFSGCIGLTSIEIPNSVTSIGSSAFSGCIGLTFLTIPNSVTSVGSSAFYGCAGLTSINIPNSVTSIGGRAFYGCSGLTSIDIPNSVTSIGAGAFDSCIGLISVTIPNSVTSIGKNAFSGCTGLTSLTIPNIAIDISWHISSHNNLTHIEAPSCFFDIAESDLLLCPKYLEKVMVNGGELNDNGFNVIKRSYKTLQSLDVSGISNTTLADEAFKDFYNLTELVLPANLTSVSYMAVAGCVHLKAIDIPASVEEIDDRAFEDCRSLETITFGGKQPSSVTGRHMLAAESKLRRIGNWAFYNAHELQHLEIPEGVTEIGDAAFYGCTYLQDLVLLSSVKSIGDNCFALCSKLQQITITSVTPPAISARTFYDVSRAIPVLVPDESVDDYLDAPYWSEMNIQGGATGIDEIVNRQSSNRKFIKDGQLLILRGEKTYTVTGQEVK